MGKYEMGDGSGPESGIQVLPINGKRPETARGGGVAMEANGRSRGARDVAGPRGGMR